MIRFARARSSSNSTVSEAAAAAGDAPPLWLHRSEAFAEDLMEHVSALPQWQQGAASRRKLGGLDGLLRDGACFGDEDRQRGDGAGASLLAWTRLLHWQGA